MRFNFTCAPDHETVIETTFEAEGIENVVEKFKMFLSHCGYHPNNVEAVGYDHAEVMQGLPQQLELPL